jgi:hypothetical protein
VYDPKAREFFIAAGTEDAEQRMIMAHELAHALEDQHFGIEQWTKAVRDNDDAGFARDAVLEGSAMIAMIDYLLRGTGRSFRDLGDFGPALMLGEMEASRELNDVPMVLRDQLLFPYLAGANFAAQALDFERPPASTQQILHPELYLRGVQPETVSLPGLGGMAPRGWKKLDENVLGEFGLNQIFKQFLGKERADDLAASWSGDRYAIFEQAPNGRTLLVVRVRLAEEADAAAFFGAYSELLKKKHASRASVARGPDSFSFETSSGGVFLRCSGRECLTAEGATRAQFEALTRAIGWPAGRADLPPTQRGAELVWSPKAFPGAIPAILRRDGSAELLPAP